MSYRVHRRLTPSRRAFLSALAQGDRNPLVQTKAGWVMSRASYDCRMLGWAEFLWKFEDGSIGPVLKPGHFKHRRSDGPEPVKVVGQRITDQGRAVLDREIASRFDDAPAKDAGIKPAEALGAE